MSWTDPEFYPDGEKPLTFYLVRKDRSPQEEIRSPGLFKTLFANPRNRMTLFSLVFLCVAIAIVTHL
jgi:hypothetical protein